MNAMLETVNLVKYFNDFCAVNDISFTVKKGSFTGLLGPNGSGKSTTLKMLCNLSSPTSGEVYINGIDVCKDAPHALSTVGCVIETPEAYPYITPTELLHYVGKLFCMSKTAITAETKIILDKVGITEYADKKIGKFSKGMKQRVALVQALINEPELLILDEPSSGLDPKGMSDMRTILKSLNDDGTTILMSSHMLHEVEELCNNVVIISQGRVIESGDLEFVKSLTKKICLTVKSSNNPDAEMLSKISSLSGVKSISLHDNSVSLSFEGSISDRAYLLREILNLGLDVYDFSESSTAFEQVFLKLTEESK